MENFGSNGEYYCRLFWAHALNRQYLITGRKHALIKKYVLNKDVRLLTRLYGIYIYLCVVLHGNDSMHMLRHHVVDLTVTGKGHHQRRLKVRFAESWQCSVAQAQIQICIVERNFRPYSSRVVAMTVAVIHGWHCFQLYCSYW